MMHPWNNSALQTTNKKAARSHHEPLCLLVHIGLQVKPYLILTGTLNHLTFAHITRYNPTVFKPTALSCLFGWWNNYRINDMNCTVRCLYIRCDERCPINLNRITINFKAYVFPLKRSC